MIPFFTIPDLQSLLPLDPIEDPPSWSWANHPSRGFSYKAKDSLSVEFCLENPKYISTARCNLPLEVCLDNPQYISEVGCSGNQYSQQTCIQYPEIISKPICTEGDNKYPVSVCLQYPETLTLPPCSYQFPVETCSANTFLLDTSKYPLQCDYQFPVGLCVQNNSILDKTQCGFPFPVEVCAENDFLLDSAQCDFQFPLETCTAKPSLFTRAQCQSQLSGSVCASNPEITLTPPCLPLLQGYSPTLFQCSDNKEALCGLNLCEKHQFIVKC